MIYNDMIYDTKYADDILLKHYGSKWRIPQVCYHSGRLHYRSVWR
jgi:hypothetical protein